MCTIRISNTIKIVKTNVIPKCTRPRGGSIYREKTKEGYEKNRVPFTTCSARLFGGSRASATSTLFRGTPASQEGHGKDLSRREDERSRETCHGRVPCAEVN